jgi:hypothetical protein
VAKSSSSAGGAAAMEEPGPRRVRAASGAAGLERRKGKFLAWVATRGREVEDAKARRRRGQR